MINPSLPTDLPLPGPLTVTDEPDPDIDTTASDSSFTLAKDHSATIWTDSQYAFNTLHVLRRRDFTTTTGTKQHPVTDSPYVLTLSLLVLPTVDTLDRDVLLRAQQNAPEKEQLVWVRLGCAFDREGYRRSSLAPCLPYLPKALFHPVTLLIHGPGHLSPGPMRSIISRYFKAPGITSFLLSFCTQCLICRQYNP